VKAINPVEGAPYVRFDGALFKGAPHPNAGRLLLDFFLSDEGQLAYGNLGFVNTVGGLEARSRPRRARSPRPVCSAPPIRSCRTTC
jgi:iron(III) transport system substrate-binding protein